jgi:hypothetical protein
MPKNIARDRVGMAIQPVRRQRAGCDLRAYLGDFLAS